jgi:hypothetical protein
MSKSAKPDKDDKDEPPARKAGAKGGVKAVAKGAAKGAGAAAPARPAAAKPAPARPAAPQKPHRPTIAFPKKNQPPTPAAFAARFPVAVGKRVDQVRDFLTKQPGVSEDVYFYGPQTGWALRYLATGRSLCSLHVHDDRPIGLIALEPDAAATVDWKALSPVGQKARKQAHGSPSLLWLDVPLEGTGAADFKALLRAKLADLGAGPEPRTGG